MGTAGAITAMVIAGLIVYGIIYYGPSIWESIQEGIGGSGELSPKEVNEHPEKYLGEIITVEGWYNSMLGISPVAPTSIDTAEEMVEHYMNSLQIDLPENIVSLSKVTKNKFTGILVEKGSTIVLVVNFVEGEGVRELPFKAGTSVGTHQLKVNPEAYEGKEIAVIGYVESTRLENWDGKIRGPSSIDTAFSIYFKLVAGEEVRTGYGVIIGTVRIRTFAWRAFPEDTPVLEDATLYLD